MRVYFWTQWWRKVDGILGFQSSQPAEGRLSLQQLERAIDARIDFQFETTLSSHRSIKPAMSAKAAGYQLGLIYVILQNAELHCLRVKSRYEKGRHSIPEDVVMRRYKKSLGNLKRNIQIFDRGVMLDNTDPVEMRSL